MYKIVAQRIYLEVSMNQDYEAYQHPTLKLQFPQAIAKNMWYANLIFFLIVYKNKYIYKNI